MSQADRGDVQAGSVPKSGESLRPEDPAAARIRILVADDSPVSRRLLEGVLRKWGFDVVSVSSGADAWQVLRSDDAPRMAILDWMMPGLSGPEVCSLVREHSRQLGQAHYTYLILLTSRSEKEDLIAGMEAGADDYLVKPFDNNELKVRLGPGRRIVELQQQLLRAQEQLREQATRDALTRLWNRHAIWEILLRELSRSYREQVPLGIVMGDLDKFKSINDHYGHVGGDTVLRDVSARIQGSVRTYDAVGRYGGEEFLIILPGCDDSSAVQAAERIRTQVESTRVHLPEGALAVTASFGVTSLPSGVRSEPEPLIRLADEALYAAKDRGRNQTSLLTYPTHLFALK